MSVATIVLGLRMNGSRNPSLTSAASFAVVKNHIERLRQVAVYPAYASR